MRLSVKTLCLCLCCPALLNFTISTRHSPEQPIAGNVQLNSTTTLSQLTTGSAGRPWQASYRADWELYITEWLGYGGLLQIPFHSPNGLRNDQVGLGINVHWLQLGDLDLSASWHGSLVFASAPDDSGGLYTSSLYALNALLIGDHFIYGVYYHLMATVGWYDSSYEHKDYSFDGLVYRLGVGWTL